MCKKVAFLADECHNNQAFYTPVGNPIVFCQFLVIMSSVVRRVVSGFDPVSLSMLKTLHLNNVGPASEMHLDLYSRLNVLTGDNGLGKSFLLDMIWWSLTRTWAADVNANLTSGRKALPHDGKVGSITATFSTKTLPDYQFQGTFNRRIQQWEVGAGRPAIPGLVFYAMSDGSFAAWDPARNYWKKRKSDNGLHIPAYVFSPTEVWDGLHSKDRKSLCNGIILDWAIWQKENGKFYEAWKSLLNHFSPPSEKLCIGPLTSIDVDDSRSMPTLQTSYGQDVPIVHTSSGVRRIVALTYFLLWGWYEHLRVSKLLGSDRSNQVIFLIDEIESHLHPSWQRVIVPSILNVMKLLHKEANVQLITATHSPLIMSSIEPEFNEATDAWFDIDFEKENKTVVLQKCNFEKLGGSDSWLCSNAFDLSSTRSIQGEQLVEKASFLLRQEKPNKNDIQKINQELVESLNQRDPYLIRWRFICEKEGWLE